MGQVYEVCQLGGFKWHEIHTKFHDDPFRHSSIIIITSTILRGCTVSITDGTDLWNTPLRWTQMSWYTYQFSWILVQAFKYYYGYYRNNLRGCSVGITDGRDVWCTFQVQWYTGFMKFGTGVQEMLSFCFSNLRGCIVGITYQVS
jgi:hypothetical protein